MEDDWLDRILARTPVGVLMVLAIPLLLIALIPGGANPFRSDYFDPEP